MSAAQVASVTGLLESSLYVADLPSSAAFYSRVFGFEVLVADERLQALAVPGGQVLLLFARGASRQPMDTPGGAIPPHDGEGQLHLAFAVAASELAAWEERLADLGVPIESRVRWPRGGQSVYFRDPDGHALELVTPGCWETY